jgi:O-antigen ligase
LNRAAVTSELNSVAGGIGRQQVIDVLRAGLFIGTLLLVWISLRPYADLGEYAVGDTSTGNDLPTYVIFAILAVVAVMLVARDNAQGLATLWTRSFLMFGGWLVLTTILSFDRGTSLRRFALTACVIAVAASMPLLARSRHEVMRWFSIAALGLLAACYLGLLLAPYLSMHLATDLQEPLLAGNWRGTFGHKNAAASMMAMLLFLGIYITREGGWISGPTIIGLCALFLVYAAGKSSLSLCFMVLLLTSMVSIVPWFWLRAVMLLTPLAMLNLLSVGTVLSPALASWSKLLPFDSTFTGRTDIWTFAVQSLQARLATGYGFQAFWGSSAIQDLPAGKEWAAFSSHSHNGYLDTALGMGLPGLALLILVLVIMPLRDFHRADTGGNGGPLAMALLRIWLFGLYLASMESFFLDRADPTWFTLLLAIFFLHYLARFRAKA